MANSNEADLMSIGQHCSVDTCQQLDFLPFKCDCCSKVFCLEHRTYTAHQCPAAGTKECTVFVCPLCARAVKMQPGDDANTAFDRHCQTECDPSNYDKVHKKKKCPVAGCKEKLTSINSYTCKECGATVCLRHRLAMDHKCPGPASRAAAAAAAAQSRFGLPSALKGLFAGGSSGSNAAAAKQPAAKAAAKQPAAKTAAKQPAAKQAPPKSSGSSSSGSIAAQLQQYRAAQQQRVGGGGGGSTQGAVIDLTGSPQPAQQPGGGGGGGAELCQQCGARFATVQQLIEHAERAHMDGWASGSVQMQGAAAGGAGGRPGAGGGASGGLERCPHCGRQFSDPVELVGHVEREHGKGRTDNCVLC